MTRPDLDTVDQITEMVRCSYHDVRNDDLLGPVFNDIACVGWNTHLPKLAAFWARALLASAPTPWSNSPGLAGRMTVAASLL